MAASPVPLVARRGPQSRAPLAVAAVVLLLGAGAFPLALLTHDVSGGLGGLLPILVGFAAMGAVVARQQPRNPIGWTMLAVAGLLVLSNDASLYSVFDYRQHGGSLPLGPVAVIVGPSWAPAILLFSLSIVLFPDGDLPPGRWRWPPAVLLLAGTVWVVGAFGIAVDAVVDHSIRIEPSGNLVRLDHPTSGWAWWPQAQTVFFALLGGFGLCWFGSRVPAYRRANGARRQQLKCLLCGGTIAVVGLALSVFADPSGGPGQGVAGVLGVIAVLCLPISLGVGVIKYRLYDIDRLISRTLSYAILTGLLVGVFIGIVVLATDVLPFSSPVAVAASTLAAAALFNPLRLRVQRLVDRRFNRARYDAEEIVAAFTMRLRDAVDLDTVRGELLQAVNGAVQPAHASVWIRPPSSRPRV